MTRQIYFLPLHGILQILGQTAASFSGLKPYSYNIPKRKGFPTLHDVAASSQGASWITGVTVIPQGTRVPVACNALGLAALLQAVR